MGLAFTLTSFTCTAPFLGTLLVVASQGDWQWPLAGMLAFSTVFALPFVVLALVPQVHRVAAAIGTVAHRREGRDGHRSSWRRR